MFTSYIVTFKTSNSNILTGVLTDRSAKINAIKLIQTSILLRVFLICFTYESSIWNLIWKNIPLVNWFLECLISYKLDRKLLLDHFLICKEFLVLSWHNWLLFFSIKNFHPQSLRNWHLECLLSFLISCGK